MKSPLFYIIFPYATVLNVFLLFGHLSYFTGKTKNELKKTIYQ